MCPLLGQHGSTELTEGTSHSNILHSMSRFQRGHRNPSVALHLAECHGTGRVPSVDGSAVGVKAFKVRKGWEAHERTVYSISVYHMLNVRMRLSGTSLLVYTIILYIDLPNKQEVTVDSKFPLKMYSIGKRFYLFGDRYIQICINQRKMEHGNRR